MEIRTVAAGRGWNWIVEGFRIFRKQPLTWITLVIVMVVIWMVCTFVLPLIGPLAINLVSPVFFAGLMLACRTTDEDGEPEFSQLFAAFKTHASPLITIGGIYLIGNIIAVGIVFAVAGGSALPALMGKATDPEALLAAARGLLLGMTVGMAVFIPILMSVWFAPLLVLFHNTPPVEALKLSFAACWHNTMPMLVYGVATLILCIIASIPVMLGLIVLLPVLVCSIYASYKDIFPSAPAATATP
jgi:uncharacterized membrane protein